MFAEVIENASPLGANGVFTSSVRDMTKVQRDFGAAVNKFAVAVDSDQAGSIQFQASTDLIVWVNLGTSIAYAAGAGIATISEIPSNTYVRVVYTNGTITQTRFTMTTGVA